jgi:uncharacterized repeat protein (TIGR01451 family)
MPLSTDPDCKTATPAIQPEPLVIKKHADKTLVFAGDKVKYTVTIRNTNADYTFSGVKLEDDFSGILDDASFNHDAAISGGSIIYISPKLIWTGNITPGETVTITYSFTLNNPLGQEAALDNVLVTPTLAFGPATISNCMPASTDPDCKTNTQAEQPKSLAIKKEANKSQVMPGDKVTYTVTIHNPNTLPFTFTNAELSDNLTDVLDDADYNNDAAATVGTINYAPPGLTWNGSVAPDETITLTYSFTAKDSPTGNRQLKNSVITPGSEAGINATDSNCLQGSTDIDCKTETPITLTPKQETPSEKAAAPEPKLVNTGKTPVMPIAAAGGFITAGAGILYAVLRRR